MMAEEAFDLNDMDGASESSESSSTRRSSAANIDFGRPDTPRHTILSLVASGAFERAQSELNNYVSMQSEYPTFGPRAERIKKHAIDLINAIRAKKNLPGINMLSVSKQREIQERVVGHMGELADAVRRIEALEREVKLEDLRSTVWVLKSGVGVVSAVVALALLIEISGGILGLFALYIDDSLTEFVNKIFDAIGM